MYVRESKMNATTLEYDRRDTERTLVQLDLLGHEREALEQLLHASDYDDEIDRLGLALDACGDAIGVLQSRLYETEYEIGLSGGEWR